MKKELKPGWIILASFIALGIAGTVEFNDEVKLQASRNAEMHAKMTAQEARLAKLFADHGSPHPVELARVVAKSKRPKLMAAQAVVESNGNKAAVGTAGERGVWQIIEKEWGIVNTHDLDAQARQYEEIMESLIRESDGNIRRALSRYNGDRSGRYAAKVLKVKGLLS